MSRTYRTFPFKNYRRPNLIQERRLNIEALDKVLEKGYNLSKFNRVTVKANFQWAWDDFRLGPWKELAELNNPYNLLDKENWFIIPPMIKFPNIINKINNYLESIERKDYIEED